MIAEPCPKCGVTLKVKPDLAGKKLRCPKCQEVVAVPVRKRGRISRTDNTPLATDVGCRVGAASCPASLRASLGLTGGVLGSLRRGEVQEVAWRVLLAFHRDQQTPICWPLRGGAAAGA